MAKRTAEKVYVICADHTCSSCIINAVYIDKERAEEWVKEENKRLNFNLYWIEQSQLIR